jgi:hypothetical protein
LQVFVTLVVSVQYQVRRDHTFDAVSGPISRQLLPIGVLFGATWEARASYVAGAAAAMFGPSKQGRQSQDDTGLAAAAAMAAAVVRH